MIKIKNPQAQLRRHGFACLIVVSGLATCRGVLQGQDASSPPVVLHIWGQGSQATGSTALPQTLTRLEAAYTRHHPTIHFANELYGNDSALGGLFIGAADLAFMTREPSYIELDGYQQAIQGQTPLQIAVMRGSPSAHGSASPLVLVANRLNSLASVTIPQVRSIFSASRSAGSPAASHWQDVGVKGPQGGRSIHLYGFDPESEEAVTFAGASLGAHPRWTCTYTAVPVTPNAAKQVSEQVAQDLDGLGLTSLDTVGSNLKVLGITISGNAVGPTSEALSSGEYPFGRTVLALARKTSGGSAEPAVRDFLSFLLSEEGQAIIRSDGMFVSLDGTETTTAKDALR
jgi:phosphate transport system substrate-binding protein